jgi:hypothetical protein
MGGEKRAPVDPGTVAKNVRRCERNIAAERQSSKPRENDDAPLLVLANFSEADWHEIKGSLEERGVDLDAQMVGRYVPGERWWLADERRPLRGELQSMAYYFYIAAHSLGFENKLSTPAQHAETARKVLTVFENALIVLDRDIMDRVENNAVTDADKDADGLLYKAMAQFVGRLRGRIASLKAMDSPRTQNARSWHNLYWHELTPLWRGVTGSAGPLRRKSLHRFLSACSRSIFPEFTTRELDQKIKSFMSNLSRNKPPRRKARGSRNTPPRPKSRGA